MSMTTQRENLAFFLFLPATSCSFGCLLENFGKVWRGLFRVFVPCPPILSWGQCLLVWLQTLPPLQWVGLPLEWCSPPLPREPSGSLINSGPGLPPVFLIYLVQARPGYEISDRSQMTSGRSRGLDSPSIYAGFFLTHKECPNTSHPRSTSIPPRGSTIHPFRPSRICSSSQG